MLRWMFWEQYNHEPNIATLRFWLRCSGAGRTSTTSQRLQIPAKRAGGQAALKLMDEHLARPRLVRRRALTLADISLFAYTHVAGEPTSTFSAIRNVSAWLERIEGPARAMWRWTPDTALLARSGADGYIARQAGRSERGGPIYF